MKQANPAPVAPKRTRLQVTPSPELWAILVELSALTGMARSELLADILDAALPALQMQMEAVRIAKESPREAERLMTRHSAEAIQQLMQAQIDFGKDIDGRTVKGKRRRSSGPT